MLIDIAWTWQELEARQLNASVAAVADVLRATTVMVAAFANGAKAVFPQAGIPAARGIYTTFQEQGIPTLLCGEIEGIKIDGFDLGNSPREYTEQTVAGKNLVHYTTNGTKALNAVSQARRTFIASFANRSAAGSAIAAAVEGEMDSVMLVASGKLANFCLEDTVCMGGVIDAILECGGGWTLTDAAIAARSLYHLHQGRILALLKECEHGAYLTQIGLEDDLPSCAELDWSDAAPELINGRISLTASVCPG